MLQFLKDHPFAVKAYFEHSLVLTFAFPKENLLNLIPPCLSLDTHNDTHAFIAVAMVQTKGLRPKGFPPFMGNDFFLIGYRVFVRYTSITGKRLRGLYIIRSQTNKKKMEFFGNIFTHYNYSTTDVQQQVNGSSMVVDSKHPRLHVAVDLSDEQVALPVGSPFNDWKEARRFAGPLPFTFTYNAKTSEVLIIEGVRDNWTPKPVKVLEYEVEWLKELGVGEPVLANCFITQNIPYEWKKGRIEQWQQ